MLLADARQLLDRLAKQLEPQALGAFDIADDCEEGIAATAQLSFAISMKRIADAMDKIAAQASVGFPR